MQAQKSPIGVPHGRHDRAQRHVTSDFVSTRLRKWRACSIPKERIWRRCAGCRTSPARASSRWAVATARATLPGALAGRVTYRVASAIDIDIPPARFDIALFSWTL